MQVDAFNNDDAQTGQAFRRAIGLLSAVAVAVAAGLATVDVPESDRTPVILKKDAVEQGVRATSPDQAPAAPARGELDPSLHRPNQNSDQHG